MSAEASSAAPEIPAGAAAASAEPSEVLDVLVVGGGPGGTAAAFRCRELGLSTLVIDYDDILKRIRDYSKDKLILPDFGGGDAMRFPRGDELVRRLHFTPIDKDEMHVSWKRLYAECEVPMCVGVELTGLERLGDGAWRARCWDHLRRAERPFVARHVVIAIGRGVPRRFDIPGNTDGVAFRLSDPALYVGAPACVIGGGTSAAEAVIAIANAKAAAGDPTDVYWSYRGDKMPRVSKALADAFFAAYMGHGNIRYHPKSEPVAVTAGEDRNDYLAIRVDRRRIDGRPSETTQLEFRKEMCLACIGEDIPESLLKNLGIAMAAAGPNRKRMLVSPLLETVQPNVYLVGDILSQAYLEPGDFAAGPAACREVKHRGNIKSALRDGVLVAEVIAQKLAGRTEIRVVIEDAPEAAAERPAPPLARVLPGGAVESDGPPAAAAPAGTPREAVARLVRLLEGDVEENEYPLYRGATLTLGRQECDLSFPDDPGISARHASIAHGPGGAFLRDEGGAGGVFLRARPGEPVAVEPGTIARAGRQFLLVAGAPGAFELRHFDATGKEVGRHPVGEQAVLFGRESPDVTLDAADFSLSRRHFAASVRNGRLLLKDLKSVNGTYLKVKAAAELADGAEFRIGRQSFRFVLGPGTPTPPAAISRQVAPLSAAAPPPRPAPSYAPAAPPAAAPAGAPTVTFQGTGKSLPAPPGRTLCEIAEEGGVEIKAECHAGICGSDPIRILSGGEHLSPLEGGESDTLQDLCNLEPGPCRLACMVRVRGPVVVEILKR
jgi:thioredoxin reductase/pSer/pThr/pTyr-binding forkhead associated (FHA) protein/ferredoxin